MQQDTTANSKRIAKNILFLYLRSIIVMAVSIYTSRVVLAELGVSDFGIYNIVGGFVSMFSVLSSSLVNANQRFISYEMGRQNPQITKMFATTFTIHLLLAVSMFIVLELVGLWFLNNKINISADRMYAANWVFHFSAITFCINILKIPFTASIIAHERMSAFAYISIFEVFAKLGIVYILLLIHTDKLILYALLMTCIAICLNAIYSVYCRYNFKECRYSLHYDKSIVKSILSFSGWNFIGSTAGILSTQGINLLVNLFFGVTLNAARGVAEQVNHAVTTFVTNFMTAINPQITKSYASGDFRYMNELMIRGAKYGALLYWLISLTVFIEADYILSVWLVKVPPFATIFLRLVIIYSIFQALSNTLYIGMLATGRIKKYQIIMGLIGAFSFPLCYFFFKCGFGPEWSYLSMIFCVFVAMFARLVLLEEIISQFSGREFFKEAILKVFFVIILSTGVVYTIKEMTAYSGFVGLSLSFFLTVFLVSALSYLFALDSKDRNVLKTYTISVSNKILKRN